MISGKHTESGVFNVRYFEKRKMPVDAGKEWKTTNTYVTLTERTMKERFVNSRDNSADNSR